jgi:hypothetical protein
MMKIPMVYLTNGCVLPCQRLLRVSVGFDVHFLHVRIKTSSNGCSRFSVKHNRVVERNVKGTVNLDTPTQLHFGHAHCPLIRMNLQSSKQNDFY